MKSWLVLISNNFIIFLKKTLYLTRIVKAIDEYKLEYKLSTERRDFYIDQNHNNSIKLHAVASCNTVFRSIRVIHLTCYMMAEKVTMFCFW